MIPYIPYVWMSGVWKTKSLHSNSYFQLLYHKKIEHISTTLIYQLKNLIIPSFSDIHSPFCFLAFNYMEEQKNIWWIESQSHTFFPQWGNDKAIAKLECFWSDCVGFPDFSKLFIRLLQHRTELSLKIWHFQPKIWTI